MPETHRCLEAFLSLTPLSPWVNTYDPANPSLPFASAGLHTYGGITSPLPPWALLAGQYGDDEVVVGGQPADPDDRTSPYTIPTLHWGSGIGIPFNATNVGPDNQFLFLFTLRAHGIWDVYAQFFINSLWVRTEKLSASTDSKIAVLTDSPPPGYGMWIFVRLGGDPEEGPILGIKQFDCYLL